MAKYDVVILVPWTTCVEMIKKPSYKLSQWFSCHIFLVNLCTLKISYGPGVSAVFSTDMTGFFQGFIPATVLYACCAKYSCRYKVDIVLKFHLSGMGSFLLSTFKIEYNLNKYMFIILA